MSDPILSCHEVVKSYHDGKSTIQVLKGVSLRVGVGEQVAVVGNSGSGKSTLLHILGALDSPDAGEIRIAGQALAQLNNRQLARLRNRELGFVYQFHHLLAEFSALENVAMPLLIAGEAIPAARERARQMLVLVGLEARLHHRPAELSGGERQRVAIARALVNRPSLVLADEPTGNLDKQTAERVFTLLTELNRQLGTSFVIVTHDLQLAAAMHRRVVLDDGQLTEGH